jgi:hypothetical protein
LGLESGDEVPGQEFFDAANGMFCDLGQDVADIPGQKRFIWCMFWLHVAVKLYRDFLLFTAKLMLKNPPSLR